MPLIIGFQPGDSVSIAGHHFTIDATVPSLTNGQGVVYALSGTAVSPVTDVQVRVANTQRWPGKLSLEFETPRNVPVLRHSVATVAEDSL